MFANNPNNGQAIADLAAISGTTPDRKAINCNTNANNSNDLTASNQGSFMKQGSRIAIINSKHQHSNSNSTAGAQQSLSARPHYQQQTQQLMASASINSLLGY
jgi:hypothetical protein